ncbi:MULTISPECIES: hypothetical protein [unclassified Zunongwangia]|uniref:hypothetical protein n=1 Tax=unclassified Zunongwangia TaxID=2632541 RepID=UPI0022DD5C75|nr:MULTISPECIES: hypothetical protein [unclassified Zunongwangia]WBL22533.1 hypothetical protein PBT89_00915 [Zunongwangia sp. HRR-M8]WBL25518.1 hypothetical protein PBT91_16680 [Zunongwangia sp. HGR-M22]
MKKILCIFLLALICIGCEEEPESTVEKSTVIETEQDTVPTLIGNFIYADEAALFRGEDFIYNVEIDSLSRSLAHQLKAYKTDDFEMIPVKVRGKIKQSPGQTGIRKNLELREIIAVLADSTKNNSKE